MRSLSHRDGRDRPVMERLDTRRVSPSARLFRALFLRLPRPLPLLGDRRLPVVRRQFLLSFSIHNDSFAHRAITRTYSRS